MGALGRILRLAGLGVGLLGVGALASHYTFAGLPWLLNLAMLKLVFLGAGGLMGSGAVLGRLATRDAQRILGGQPND